MSTTTATKSKKTTKPQTMLYDNPALNKAKKSAAPFSAPISEVHLVPLDLIDTIEQFRKKFDQESIENLAKDIKAHGLLQPVLLNPNGDRFQLIAGERRLMAIRLNGSAGIPALIVKTSAEDAMLMQIAENIQRERLTLEEECAAICKLYELLGRLAKVAEAVKKSIPWCSKRYSLTIDMHYIAKKLLQDGITEDLELLQSYGTLAEIIGWPEYEKWDTAIRAGNAGRKEIREALKKAKEEKAKKLKKVSHAKPEEPPPTPVWEIDDAIYGLQEALSDLSDTDKTANELFLSWTEEQQAQIKERLENCANEGKNSGAFTAIGNRVLFNIYKPKLSIEWMAMINGYGNQTFDLFGFFANLQKTKEKA